MTATFQPTQQATWQVDPTHTDVEFAVRHLMISTVKGRFSNVTGSASFNDSDPRSVALDVTIPVAAIDTGVEQRDNHLRSADFFDVANHAAITFKAKRIDGTIGERFRLIGDLTIRGTTREVALDVTLEGEGKDPWGNQRRGYSATGKIDRRDFGLTWNQALETGGVAVGHDVKITIHVELMRPLALA